MASLEDSEPTASSKLESALADEKTETPLVGSIDPANEIKGINLVVVNTALILATFLTGLVLGLRCSHKHIY
jgi:hypothetical protein